MLLDLPVAEDFSNIDYVASFNKKVRKEFSEYLNVSDKRRKYTKGEIKRLFVGNDKFFSNFLAKYREDDIEPYDFIKDKNGEIKWYYISKEFVKENPLDINKKINIYKENIKDFDNKIITKYKKLDNLNRVIVNEFIDKIYVGEVKDNIRIIKIKWNF